MASRATSRAADGVALSTPVTYCTTLLRPVKRGFPIYRRIFARHLPGSRSNARTTKCLYSMRAPPEIATVSEYATGVSESFRQAGNNVALSRALLSVGTKQSKPARIPVAWQRCAVRYCKGACNGHHMLGWWRRRRALAEADARNLIARFGERANQEARLRVIDAQNNSVIDANRPACHWKRVQRLIARCLPAEPSESGPRFLHS